MTSVRERLVAEFEELEHQIDQLRRQIASSEGLTQIQLKKQLTTLLLRQKNVQERLEMTAQSAQQ